LFRAKTEAFGVLVRLGKVLVVVALVATITARWAVLQTVAWTTMLADNLQSAPLQEALTKTFDGKHPCCLCKAIAARKESERKKEVAAQMQKIEFPPAGENFALIVPSQFQLVPQANNFADPLAQKPPTPPPRGFFV
jgi:hypothetical protein